MYIGAGCFWHVQKVVNMAEEMVLGRSGTDITGFTGYAGGRDSKGDICYTNYGGKGQTEVVVFRVPRERVSEFAKALWSGLFENGERQDGVNRGGEYRAALGLPGGASGDAELLEIWDRAQGGGPPVGAALEPGAGDEEDTYGKRKVYVYDSTAFPFHQAELYHQFHDYKGNYLQPLVDAGRLRDLDCPSETLAMLQSPMMTALICLVAAILCCCGCMFVWTRMSSRAERAGARDAQKVGVLSA